MEVIEFTPTAEQYAHTFGGVTPVSSVPAGTNLVVDGALRRGIHQ